VVVIKNRFIDVIYIMMKKIVSNFDKQTATNKNLLLLIKSSRSISEDDDVANWIDILPKMSVEQKNRLHEILLHEQLRLEKIDRKYEVEQKE